MIASFKKVDSKEIITRQLRIWARIQGVVMGAYLGRHPLKQR
jgi:hypothetical protein